MGGEEGVILKYFIDANLYHVICKCIRNVVEWFKVTPTTTIMEMDTHYLMLCLT
jgi:hypothetical protein